MNPQQAEKQLAAQRAAALVQSGMRVGLGSGSTSAMVVRALGERVRHEGLEMVGVPSSSATRKVAIECGVPLLDDEAEFELDIAIDGADEATREGWLIKGGGGAHLQERIVAAAAKRFVVVADASKLVGRLGKFPLPIELFPLGHKNAIRKLEKLGGQVSLRTTPSGSLLVTDQNNVIVDCRFPSERYAAPHALAAEIEAIIGVADHGLFLGLTDLLIIGRGDSVEEFTIAR